MSRWICIDNICIPSDENDWDELVAFADAVAEQEPIDLVTCAECKYEQQCRKAVEHTTYGPTSITIECKSVNSCSYGSRKE